MHLFGRAFEYPSTTARKKSVTDQSEIGSSIGDVARGMTRNIEDLEVETKIWKGNGIAALDRAIDCRNILTGGTKHRHLPRTENLGHTTDVITVVVGQQDCARYEIPFLENLENK